MDNKKTELTPELKAAYAECLRIAKSHYENFPVASILLSKQHRLPVAAVYAFARTADDIADEGDASDEERISQLEAYAVRLQRIAQGKDTLYKHAIEGYTGPDGGIMPPKGGNPALTEEQIHATVDWMLGNLK